MILVEIDSGTGARRVDLLSYLDADAEERAHDQEYAWIKAIRHLRVDGVPFRSRFTFRGDSLWWFAEIYLHKQRAILDAFRTLEAFDALVQKEHPLALRHLDGGNAGLLAGACAGGKVRYAGPAPAAWTGVHALRMDARARLLGAAARLSRLRPGGLPTSRTRIAAFVHAAFWRGDHSDGTAESYIGPVLHALETRVAPGEIRYVGVGPRLNFRTRRWWHPLVQSITGGQRGVVPIEQYASAAALAASRGIFRARHEMRRSLWGSDDLRAHAVLKGCDCWPLVREELAGVALLQWPWSARAMDEAAAALERLTPSTAVTYAEAGGWGRAIALECRRRGIPLVGLQHGFIYRHWLNYRHEPDEMMPDARNDADRGFPAPARTLLFDEHAARHLAAAGHYRGDTLLVTGSARLDNLVSGVRGAGAGDIDRIRRAAGACSPETALIVFAGKEREAAPYLPALVDAVRELEGVQLAIKPHPAETPDVYRAVASRAPNVRVLAADTALPTLLAAACGIVTVNSTIAVDALEIGVPSLVIGLPNNLSPFVDAGVMLGAAGPHDFGTALRRLVYDQKFRSQVHTTAGSDTAGRRAVQDGNAAARAAGAILECAGAQTR